MKFIRTIIDERGRGTRTAAADGTPSAKRTYTRISAEGVSDDTLKRLVAQNQPVHPDSEEDPLRSLLDTQDDTNLFAEDDEDEAAGWDEKDKGIWDYNDDPANPDDILDEPVREPDPRVATRPEPRPAAHAIGDPAAGRSVDPVPEAAPAPRQAETSVPQMAPAAAQTAPVQAPVPDAATIAAMASMAMPAPASGRSAQSAGRVKTRLLGFNGDMGGHDPFARAGSSKGAGPEDLRFPVGWLVVIAGPGRGHAFALSPGVSQIGRGEDQTIRLDFGDTAISRSNHAAIAYDPEEGTFYLGHGGKANMVRLNNRPVLSTEPMSHGSVIRIGETTLRFAAFCDSGFQWDRDGRTEHASIR